MMHSSTIPGSMPARRTASRTTIALSSGAVKPLRTPRNLPVGVRTALTMTDSRIGLASEGDPRDRSVAEERLQALKDQPARSLHFARPLRAGGLDDEHPVLELHGSRARHCRSDCRR